MREETGHKIILQMTDKGLRALRLESAQLADALENLKAGRRPQGTEIEEVPDDFLPLANCLETLGRGWMLLDSEGNLEQKAPSALDAPSQLMEELKLILAAQPGLERQPHEQLTRRIFDFLNDESQLLQLMVEIQNSVGVSLGAFFGEELLRRMDARGGLCPVCWEKKHCTHCSQEFEDDDYDSDNDIEPEPEPKVPVDEALSRNRRRSEEYALLLSPTEPLWDVSAHKYSLVRCLKRMLFEIFDSTGVQFPDVSLSRLSDVLEDGRPADLEPGEYVLTRRRREVFRGRIDSEISGLDRIEALTSELKPILLGSIHKWLSISQIAELVSDIQDNQPGLWEEFQEVGGSVRELRKLAQSLLREGYSIRDLATILECCVDHSEDEDFRKVLTEKLSEEGKFW